MPRVWFVTGSSRGLGRSLVEAVLASGDSVVATARKSQQLSDLVDKYGSDRVLAVDLDVTNNDQVINAVAAGHEKFKHIDVVVNNAGYAGTSSIEDMDIEAFRAQIDANFFGVLYVTKAVLPILRQQGSGHIFQVSSVGGRMGSPGLSAYQSAKWAVGGFSTVLSKEVAPFGIKVTVLEPGGMKTDWGGSSMVNMPLSQPYEQTVGAFKILREKLSAATPPEKVVNAILYVSNQADPPLRLLLGEDAMKAYKQVGEELAASDAKWVHVTKLQV